MLNFVFDTETTGLNPFEDYIVSLAYEIYNDSEKLSSGYFILDWTKLVPDFKIKEAAYKINKISMDDVKNYGISPIIVFNSIYNDISSAMKQTKSNRINMIAYNLPFDIGMMRANILRAIYAITTHNPDDSYEKTAESYDDSVALMTIFNKFFDRNYYSDNFHVPSRYIDALQLFACLHPDSIYHRMQDALKYYHIEDNENAHNAKYDVMSLVKIVEKQLEELKAQGIDVDDKLETMLAGKHQVWVFDKERKYGSNFMSNNYFATNVDCTPFLSGEC